MTRILADAVMVDEDRGTLDGYAIGPRPLDTERGRPLLVVELDRRHIGTAPLDRLARVPKTIGQTISWDNYLTRQRGWGRSLLAGS